MLKSQNAPSSISWDVFLDISRHHCGQEKELSSQIAHLNLSLAVMQAVLMLVHSGPTLSCCSDEVAYGTSTLQASVFTSHAKLQPSFYLLVP